MIGLHFGPCRRKQPGDCQPDLDIRVRVELVLPGLFPLLTQLVETAVGQLTDKLAEVETALDEAIARVQGDVTTLQAEIARLTELVNSGGATAEDMATLERLKAKAMALDPVQEGTLGDVPSA